MKKLTLIISLVFSLSSLFSQVTTDPVFPAADDPVTIYLDATGTGLEGYTGDVYTHSGVTVDGNQWQNVIGSWGNNTNQPMLTNVGTDLYELEITPSIRDFYGVSASADITEMSFVFRSEDGSQQTSPDIFIEVYAIGLNVNIVEPSLPGIILELNDILEVNAAGLGSDSLALFLNNIWTTSAIGDELLYTINANDYGKFRAKIFAYAGGNSVVDSFYYFVRPAVVVENLPVGIEDGINYIDDNTVILCLYAPEKDYVFAIGDFSNWEVGDENYMKKTTDNNRYWVQLNNLIAGKEYIYQYFIDGDLTVGDTYADKISDPWNDHYIESSTYPNLIEYPEENVSGIATIFQTAQDEYQWNIANFQGPANTDLVIYELLVRDFVEDRNMQAVIDTLGYLKTLGVNAIELMPVNEFEGNNSWGYNPCYYFAFDKYYGTKNKFKEFIDIAHENGIAVIMDIALNHSFGQSPLVRMYWDAVNNQPAANNPWYNQTAMHDFNVGYDFNHESEATKQFVDRVIKYWMNDYKIDGYRFDLSKGFTQNNTLGNTAAWGQYDASRVSLWKNIADAMWAENPNSYVILEHFADNSEEQELAEYGMLLWGNVNYNYAEAAMGWNSTSDINWASYQSRGWSQPNLISYMESHDEERIMAKNLEYGNSAGGYDIQTLNTALARMELVATFFFTIPGPKMIWQFGELGYDYHINYPGTIGGNEYRTHEKPVEWGYFYNEKRNKLFSVYKALIDLKKNEPAFKSTDFSMSAGNWAMKRININHADMNVTVIGNFDVAAGTIDPNFQHTGWWYDFFAGDSINVSDVNATLSLDAGEYKLYTTKRFDEPSLQTEIVEPDDENFEANEIEVFPNPSSDEVYFQFNNIKSNKVKLTIYNNLGQQIRIIHAENLNTASQIIEWDGNDNFGNETKTGLYFYEIESDNFVKTGKIVRLK